MTISNDIDQNEIDQIVGVKQSEGLSSGTPLLTNEQKSDMLSPPSPWYAKSSGQIAVVALVVVPVGWLFYALFSSSGSAPEPVATTAMSANEELLVKQLEAEKLARQASDRDAAFGAQQAMAAPVVVQPTKPAQATKTQPKPPAPQNVSRGPVVSRSAPPPRVVYRSAPAPAPAPVSRAYNPAPRQTYSRPTFTPSVPKEDPQQAWERLAQLGSYAGSATSTVASNSPYSPAANTPTAYTPAVYTPSSVIESEYTPSPEMQSMGVGNDPYFPSDSSSTYFPSTVTTLAAGTEAKAKLTTPILWAQDINISEDEFLVKLTKPLGSALPEGSLVVIKPDKISGAGLVQFKAIRATVNGQDQVLPEGIRVGSTDGGFIRASLKRPGSGIKFADVFGVLLGGASTATSLINQPSSSSSFTSSGGFTQTVNNSQPDVLAAFGQGAADALLNRAQSRVQQIQDTRSPYFWISSGTEVKLIVTQTVSM